MNPELLYFIRIVAFYFLVIMIINTVLGIVSACIGSSFWWGFFFGPIGILIAAVRVNTKQKQVVIIGNQPSRHRRIRIVRPRDEYEDEPERIQAAPRSAPRQAPRFESPSPYIATKTGQFQKRA